MPENEEYLVIEVTHPRTPTKSEIDEFDKTIELLSDDQGIVKTARTDWIGAEPITVTVIVVSFAVNVAAGALVSWLYGYAQERRLKKANQKALEAIALHHLLKTKQMECETREIITETAFTEFLIVCPNRIEHRIKVTPQGVILD